MALLWDTNQRIAETYGKAIEKWRYAEESEEIPL
jgi:hypothetical protein